jgi:hypothetical protein
VRTSPLFVAVSPSAACTNSGMYRIAPNMPMLIRNVMITDAVKMRLRNRSSGMVGAAARLSMRRNAAPNTTAATSRPMTCGLPQG